MASNKYSLHSQPAMEINLQDYHVYDRVTE